MRNCALTLSALLTLATAAAAQTSSPADAQPLLAATALGPRTLNGPLIACADLPTSTLPVPVYWIVAGHAGDLHQQYKPGELVVLNGGIPQGLAAGQQYYVRRLQLGLTGEPPSLMNRGAIRTAGWLTVVAADDRSSLARVDFACDALEAGDYLEPFASPVLPTVVAADGPADFSNLGRVLFGPDRRQTFGAGDLLSIDRGRAGGMTLGTRVAFYRDRQERGRAGGMTFGASMAYYGDRLMRMRTPLVEMGVGVVVEVSAETSKVVVTRAMDAVARGDYFAVRGAPNP